MELAEKIQFEYEQRILSAWEDVVKKGQLTLWILLALENEPKTMAEIKIFIENKTNQTITADDRSMYRALRRFDQMELIDFNDIPSVRGGPVLKKYFLTGSGQRILRSFVQKNIVEVYLEPENQKLLKGKQ